MSNDKRFFTVKDGMGFMPTEEMSAGYAVADKLSKIHKAKPYTLKKICEINYACKFGKAPSAVTDKMKTYARYTLKNPMHVYIICPEVNSTVESKINMWCNDPERKFRITTIETAAIEPRVATYTPVERVFSPTFTQRKDSDEDKDTKHVKYFVKIRTADGRKSQRLRSAITYDAHYDEDISDARRCSIKWGTPMGWTFSAPLERGIQFIDADYHTYRNRLSVFGAGKRTQDKIDDPDFEIPTIESLNYDWWKCKMSGKGDPDTIANVIEYYKRGPQKEEEQDTRFITREELEANHAKLSPTRHTVGAFQAEFVRRAPESECEEFFKYYKKVRANAGRHHMWVMGQKDPIFYETEARDENGKLTFYTTEGYRFDECLDPDWAICPVCGDPYKTVDAGESDGMCGKCKTKLEIMSITRTEQYAVTNALYGDSSSDEN